MKVRIPEVGAESSVDQTRLRIVEAARELYALKGSRGTTTREIAERAGVNETTIFRHFGTKLALLDAMREHFCSVSQLRETLAGIDGPLEEVLEAIGLQVHEQMVRDQDLICVALAEAQLAPHSAEISWRVPREKKALITEFFQRRIASGELRGEAQAIAGIFLGTIFSHVMGRHVWKLDQMPPERFIKLLVTYLLDGVRVG
ncbi:MAG TPA: TetR/AcrR family transcriptional regulator [Candidatus Baltobacteraceae bacterium]|nr:TetR/AcrR family transcriptional regulator [Candidatus Baltobacteraceae bacterium]